MKTLSILSLGIVLCGALPVLAMDVAKIEQKDKAKYAVRQNFVQERILVKAIEPTRNQIFGTVQERAFIAFAEEWQKMDKKAMSERHYACHKAFRTALKHAERAAFLAEKTGPAAEHKIAPVDKEGFALVACWVDNLRQKAAIALEDAVAKFIVAATFVDDKALRKAVKNASHKGTQEALDASADELIALVLAVYKRENIK